MSLGYGSRRLEGDLDRSSVFLTLLLFLELFTAGVDGDCETDLGLLLLPYQYKTSVEERRNHTLK